LDDSVSDFDLVAGIDNVLERDHRVCTIGDDSAGRDAHRRPSLERLGGGDAGRDPRYDGKDAGRVLDPERKAVHGGRRERRQVHDRTDVLGCNAPCDRLDGHILRSQGTRAFENCRLRSGEREQLGHPAAYAIAVISVVVPVHDEERSVALLYDELRSALDQLHTPWEAIFVDDGSTDGTFSALTRLHDTADNVRVVRLRRNFGKAAALVAGFDQARGDIVVTIDGDLQDDPAEIPRLLAKLDEGFDLVSGWKTRRRDPLTRRILSRLFNSVTSRFSGVRLHDMNCGLKAYRAEVVHGLRLYGELHRFIPVLAHYRGFRIAELPVNHRPREHGRSRYGIERYLRGFLDLLTVSFIGRYRHRPLHLFGGLGLLLSLLGVAILVYLTIDKALGHAIGGRPLLTLGVLLVVVGMQFFSLGLISEMITSHHEERAQERERAELLVDEILS
jgi:glycosyltransferase involved in cell wall biosynthesis